MNDVEINEQMKQVDVELKGCSQACLEHEVECDFRECESWINFKEDNNCDLISIKKHGQMTFRQIGQRLGISYVRVKQIEDNAVKKIKNELRDRCIEY